MIHRKTVIVVGAGASNELGFPLGPKLLSEVGESLKFHRTGHSQSPRNATVWQAIQHVCWNNGDQIPHYIAACERVSQAATLGISIDNVIHQHRDDELFVRCAKIGIAEKILEFERKSALHDDQDESVIKFDHIAKTWLAKLLQAVVMDNERASIYSMFDNLTVISFNYDRTILRFLPFGLATQFSISRKDAEGVCRNLKVFHPYGSLGHLPWQNSAKSVSFGRNSVNDLPEIADNIRTFTEQPEPGSDYGDMQDRLKTADQIIFLGFGYIQQNLEILLGDRVGFSARSVTGTGFKLTSSDMSVVPTQLHSMFAANRSGKEAKFIDMICSEFLHDQFRAITAR